ncbi:hypothetical protein [Kitasatospora sp. NBC_01302]|uniref:hypothetical protein n=1 Tax=Kitasatospora sp. NBC_01302 TaxID=2903575 RepID=UPI002E1345BF
MRRYTLTEGERSVTRDLCAEHGEPVEELMEEPPEPAEAQPARKAAVKKATAKKAPAKKAPAKKTAGRPRGTTKTMTVEEIAQLSNPQ